MDYHNVIEFDVLTLYNAVSTLLKTVLMYRNYRLELSSDPNGLRHRVPSLPDFSSDPLRLTTHSAAHLCRTKITRHEILLPLSAINASLTILVDADRLPMNRVGVVTYAPVSVSPNPKVFIIHKEWIEESIATLSARHSRASEVSPARSFVEAVFLAKNCRGRYKK